MATHSSILAWEIPWREEPGGLQSMGFQRVRHDLATKPSPPPQVVVEVSVGDYIERGKPRELWETTVKLMMTQETIETLWNDADLLNYKAINKNMRYAPGHYVREKNEACILLVKFNK